MEQQITPDIRPQIADIDQGMWFEIDAIITANNGKPGSVITVLRECQDVVGYLPVELIDYISRGLNIPPSDVYGVASFYSLFSMTPKGRHTVKICTGTACYVKGVKEIIARISNEYQLAEGGITEDRRYSLETVRCLGACGLAPVMVVDEETHGAVTSDGVIDILDHYD